VAGCEGVEGEPPEPEPECLLTASTDQCGLLVETQTPMEDCDCYNYCDGELLGCCAYGEFCGLGCPSGSLVAGCQLGAGATPTTPEAVPTARPTSQLTAVPTAVPTSSVPNAAFPTAFPTAPRTTTAVPTATTTIAVPTATTTTAVPTALTTAVPTIRTTARPTKGPIRKFFFWK
jgi:hypothetical protein